MIIINPNVNMLILQPAVACQRAKGSESESRILYDEASSAINSSNAFITFLVIGATNKDLIGTLALMPYGSFYDFTHTNQKITFGYERDAMAFVQKLDDDDVDFRLVDGKGKFLDKDKMLSIADTIASLPKEEQEKLRRLGMGLSSKKVTPSSVPHIHISKLSKP